jgi:hypothetical protein
MTNKLISVDQDARSRRNFFAKAGAVLAAAGVAPKLMEAQTPINDAAVLNFALRLERLEATFYTVGMSKFAASDFAAANFAKTLTAAQATNAYLYFQTILAHEVSHVAQISAAIVATGGTVAQPDCYGFQIYGGDTKTFATADSFVAVAMLLENTGVTAYDGALATIQSPTILTTAASIATVEARHAAYVNQLNGVIPFPTPYDTPANQTSILAGLSNFIASCTSFPATSVPGPSAIVTPAKTMQLNSSGSTTANGLPIVAWQWEVVLGSLNSSVMNPNSPTPTVTFLGGPGVYTYTLVVTDSAGNQGVNALKVTYTGS